MKRKLLLLAVMALMVFGFSSLGLADQDPNDPGVADTLYLECYPGDDSLFPPGPWLIRMPLYITHDLPTTNDSISGMTIPLFYTHSNPTKYCSLTTYNNDLCLTTACPPLDWVLSIFRNLPEIGDTNWMWDRASQPYPNTALAWDTKILELASDSSWIFWAGGKDSAFVPPHFWLILAASGSEDQRMWGGSRILLATMTFKLEDSMRICIDTCFWPPQSRLNFGAGALPTYTYLPIIWDDYIPAEEVCVQAFIPDGGGVKEIPGSEDSRPSEFFLSQNYPNPFNPATNFQFSLPKSVHVRVEIFNIVGQKVRTLVNEQMKPGVYLVDWDGEDEKGSFVSSGIYFYRMQAGDFSDMKKMVLVK